MTHRPPTRSDIGKMVEFSQDGVHYYPGRLLSLHFDGGGYQPFLVKSKAVQAWRQHCRVPYTTPDPIAELSIAADMLADNGMDEAARVLMDRINVLTQLQGMNAVQPEELVYAELRAAREQIERQILNSLIMPKEVLMPPTDVKESASMKNN